jgi:hypothetical protein
MSTTWTNIKARYSAAFLRSLTNPDTQNPAGTSDTQGENAVTAAVSIFKQEVQLTYDDTSADHLASMYELVIYTLQTWANKLGDSAKTRHEMVYGMLHSLRDTTSRKRVTATTSSPLTPTSDADFGTAPFRPEFDRIRFGQVTPNDPFGAPGSLPNPFPN